MFGASSQKKYWMFKNEEEITDIQRLTHDQFVQMHGGDRSKSFFLSFEEARAIRTCFEKMLLDFCCKFKPPMPKNVLGTAMQYYKRFYIKNSVMDYHPKEILVTAAYLSCKVEEFNVSIEQFVANLKGNKERAMEIVLNSELLLMKELGFHLTVHNPYRPVEGLLIDLKARCDTLSDAECLRPEIENFLRDVSLTNAAMIYAPSQIALAAITFAASKIGVNIDAYVTTVLFSNCDDEKLSNIIDAVKNIRLMAKSLPAKTDSSAFKQYGEKLERCRNQDNNPDSQNFKRKIQELLEDEEERGSKQMKMDTEYEDPIIPLPGSD